MGAAAAYGGGLGQVGGAILQELRMLREALGELKGLKEKFSRLGDRLAKQFAKDCPELWEEEWDMEEDRDWVKEEMAEIRMEKAEYHEFVRLRREVEDGVPEGVRGPKGKADMGEKERGEEEEEEEEEEEGEEGEVEEEEGRK
jgi:hypothetical protein